MKTSLPIAKDGGAAVRALTERAESLHNGALLGFFPGYYKMPGRGLIQADGTEDTTIEEFRKDNENG